MPHTNSEGNARLSNGYLLLKLLRGARLVVLIDKWPRLLLLICQRNDTHSPVLGIISGRLQSLDAPYIPCLHRYYRRKMTIHSQSHFLRRRLGMYQFIAFL